MINGVGVLYRYPHPHVAGKYLYVGQGSKRDHEHRIGRSSFGRRFYKQFPDTEMPRPEHWVVFISSQQELNEEEIIAMFENHTWCGYEGGMNLSIPGSVDYSIMGIAGHRSIPADVRSNISRKRAVTLGPEGLAKSNKKREQTLGFNGISEIVKKAKRTQGLEGCRAAKKKAEETLGPEGRSAAARKRIANMSIERRKEIAAKGLATRRARGTDKVSDETRRNMSKSRLGRKHSPEAKEKVRQAKLAYWKARHEKELLLSVA